MDVIVLPVTGDRRAADYLAGGMFLIPSASHQNTTQIQVTTTEIKPI